MWLRQRSCNPLYTKPISSARCGDQRLRRREAVLRHIGICIHGFRYEKLSRYPEFRRGLRLFFFSQRSNFRYDIRIEFQNLTHGLGGTIFPDLDWIIKGYRKTLVFCDSISLAFRVFGYLKKKMPSIVEHAL